MRGARLFLFCTSAFAKSHALVFHCGFLNRGTNTCLGIMQLLARPANLCMCERLLRHLLAHSQDGGIQDQEKVKMVP